MLATAVRSFVSSENSTNLFVVVTGLQKELAVEQIRACYENVGGVLRMKVYSTPSFQNIAILELDNPETFMRASCRRVHVGSYHNQAIYAYRQQMPELGQLIRKKTKLKMQYEIRDERDPRDFKDSLLQFLSKTCGFFNVKKCRCVGLRGDITLSVEPSFSLSKISSSPFFTFQKETVSFTYIVDELDESSLANILIPKHLTLSPQEPSRGANLNFVISTFCQNMIDGQVAAPDRTSCDQNESGIQSLALSLENTTQDHLEELDCSEIEKAYRTYFLEGHANAEKSSIFRKFPAYFSETENFSFLENFGNKLLSNYYRKGPLQIPESPEEKPNPASGILAKESLQIAPLRLDKTVKPTATPQPNGPSVPVELKVVEILHRLVQVSALSSGSSPCALAREVYSSIAAKIDPETPSQQMLRVTLKILKTKYRKVKRRERKRDGRLGREVDDQDESGDEDQLGAPKADGHPLVCEVVSQLQTSQETGYTFSNQDLWRVLQSCDPEWRDFIWKYRTNEEYMNTDLAAHLSGMQEENKPFVQLNNLYHNLPNSAQHSKYPRNPTEAYDHLPFYEQKPYQSKDLRINGTPSANLLGRAPSVTPTVKASTFDPFSTGFRLSSTANLPLELKHKVQRVHQPKTSPNTSVPLNTTSPSTHSEAGTPSPPVTSDDRWIAQHLESNLRFNRMVSPILWR